MTLNPPNTASDRKFQALADCSPFGIFHTDNKGAAVYTNAAWQKISGLSAAETLGYGWTAVVHPDDRERVVAAWKATTSSGRDFDAPYRIVRPDGELRHVHVKARLLDMDDGGEGGYVGVVHDISEQVETAEQLRDNNVLLQTMLAHIPCGISVFDKNLKLQVGNPLFRQLLDLPDELFDGAKATFHSLNMYTARRLAPDNPEAGKSVV